MITFLSFVCLSVAAVLALLGQHWFIFALVMMGLFLMLMGVGAMLNEDKDGINRG
jgi:hypothetical protein